MASATQSFALTKIQPPRARASLVARERLEERMTKAALGAPPRPGRRAGRLRQDRGAGAPDRAAARQGLGGVDLGRPRRRSARPARLPDRGARAARSAVAHRSGSADRRRRRQPQRPARRRDAGPQRPRRLRRRARPDRPRRRAPGQRRHGVRVPRPPARALAAAMGRHRLEPDRSAADLAGAAARPRRARRVPPARAALHARRSARAAAAGRRKRGARPRGDQPAALPANPRLGGRPAPGGQRHPLGPRRAGGDRRHGRRPPRLRLPAERSARRAAGAVALLPAALLGARRAHGRPLRRRQRRSARGRVARGDRAARPLRLGAARGRDDAAPARPVPRFPARPPAPRDGRRAADAATGAPPPARPTCCAGSAFSSARATGARRKRRCATPARRSSPPSASRRCCA